jgi:hypothetical protein
VDIILVLDVVMWGPVIGMLVGPSIRMEEEEFHVVGMWDQLFLIMVFFLNGPSLCTYVSPTLYFVWKFDIDV